MKLDPAALRYLTDDDFRVLTAVEMGMRNHELVPVPLISTISGLRHGGYMRSLKQIHKHKLVHKESKRYVGYRLTTLGYDYLALRALVKRGVIEAVGRSLGVGKEADVFIVTPSEQLMDEYPELMDESLLAMKLHRLGRTSFRSVKSKRDYLVHRKSASWIYFSRLAAMKEYAFMCALHQRGFPVPRPLGQSRHIVVMQLCPGTLLNQVHEMDDAVETANSILRIAVRFAQHGLVHCDLNEFNILVEDDGEITVIDFPQMVSTAHVDAEQLFDRDIDGIRRFFQHRFGVDEEQMIRPDLDEVVASRDNEDQLDVIVSASGFKSDGQQGRYGIQDLGEDGDITSEQVTSFDFSHLQISATEDTSANCGDDSVYNNDATSPRVDGEDDVGNESGSDATDANEVHNSSPARSLPGTTLNHAAIEARVRRQRANQKQRRHLARRNIVKDSEKRKIKAEVQCEVWQ